MVFSTFLKRGSLGFGHTSSEECGPDLSWASCAIGSDAPFRWGLPWIFVQCALVVFFNLPRVTHFERGCVSAGLKLTSPVGTHQEVNKRLVDHDNSHEETDKIIFCHLELFSEKARSAKIYFFFSLSYNCWRWEISEFLQTRGYFLHKKAVGVRKVKSTTTSYPLPIYLRYLVASKSDCFSTAQSKSFC